MFIRSIMLKGLCMSSNSIGSLNGNQRDIFDLYRSRANEDQAPRRVRLDGRGGLSNKRVANELSLEQSGFGIDRNKIFSTQTANKFINKNRDLLYVIDQSDAAKDILSTKKSIKTRDQLSDVIAEAAHSLLKGEAANKITQNNLSKKPEIAAFILLNTAGLRDLVNDEDNSIADVFTNEAELPESSIVSKLAEKAAAQFDEDSPLNDKEFFKNNPKVAAFLLVEKDFANVYKRGNSRNDKAQSFKNQVNEVAFQNTFNNFIAKFAADSTTSGFFTQNFFSEDNSRITLAEFVAAGEFGKEIPSFTEYLESNPHLLQDNKALNDRFNFREVVTDIVSNQALNLLSATTPITKKFLSENPSFSSYIINNEGIRKKLSEKGAEEQLSVILKQSQRVFEVSSETLGKIRGAFESRFRDPNFSVSIFA